MIRSGETICAPATGRGGALALIRISGPQSISICSMIFTPAGSKKELSAHRGNSVIYGTIHDSDEVIDDVLVSVYTAPHSYTGEDSVEISCHGSGYIQTRIMELLIKHGALSAYPGEFTQRAFLNGKMDLSQAEAVADLVASASSASHKLAFSQMRGGFSSEISKLRKDLLHFATLIELELDFGEEDVEFADRKELLKIVKQVKYMSEKLATSFKLGNAIRNGIPVAIVGKPNSGKSTLLNTLLMEERAIVSEIPGTTRDIIEDTIVIDGIEYRFIDTAGLRETADVIETIGIKKTHEKIEQASVVLLVDEVNDKPGSVNKRIENIRKVIRPADKKLIIIINKADLAGKEEQDKLEKMIDKHEDETLLFLSAKNKTGIDKLKATLGQIIEKDKLDSADIIITNIRHYEALTRVSESLGRVEDGLNSGVPDDLVSIDIRHAIRFLGEITGEISTDEILGNIFLNFCIGK